MLSLLDHWVSYRIYIDPILVSELGECVQCFLGIPISLLEPKDEIDPGSNILRYVLRFEGLSQIYYEEVWIILTPRRELYVINCDAILFNPKVNFILVNEHLRAVVKLWDQLPDVSIVI